jgi:hypothetical protein
MATRAVLQTFERYQKERVAFVSAVAEMAKNPQNIEALQQAGAMALLRPLLLDNVPRWERRHRMRHALVHMPTCVASGWGQEHRHAKVAAGTRRRPAPPPHNALSRSIQQSAAMALGRLANYSDDLAEAVVANEILPQLVCWPPGCRGACAALEANRHRSVLRHAAHVEAAGTHAALCA